MIWYNQEFKRILYQRARRKVFITQDAEDVLQNAYFLYLKYKDTLKGNPKAILNWLVDQESIRVLMQRNKYRKSAKTGEVTTYEHVSYEDVAEFVPKAHYNEGEVNLDLEYLERLKVSHMSPIEAKFLYINGFSQKEAINKLPYEVLDDSYADLKCRLENKQKRVHLNKSWIIQLCSLKNSAKKAARNHTITRYDRQVLKHKDKYWRDRKYETKGNKKGTSKRVLIESKES